MVIAILIFFHSTTSCQYAAVVNASVTSGLITDGANIGTATDPDIVEDDILDSGTIGIGNQSL